VDRSQTAGALPARSCDPAGSSGITGTFAKSRQVGTPLSLSSGYAIHALLTRSPLTWASVTQCPGPFDLHALATPPTFVLSQDQTLRLKSVSSAIAVAMTVGFRRRAYIPCAHENVSSVGLHARPHTVRRPGRVCGPGLRGITTRPPWNAAVAQCHILTTTYLFTCQRADVPGNLTGPRTIAVMAGLSTHKRGGHRAPQQTPGATPPEHIPHFPTLSSRLRPSVCRPRTATAQPPRPT
jgi:hypothetical protein